MSLMIFLNTDITEYEIEKAVEKLKYGKAPCYDNVTNEHIVSTLLMFLPLYKKFVNAISNRSTVSNEWFSVNC